MFKGMRQIANKTKQSEVYYTRDPNELTSHQEFRLAVESEKAKLKEMVRKKNNPLLND